MDEAEVKASEEWSWFNSIRKIFNSNSISGFFFFFLNETRIQKESNTTGHSSQAVSASIKPFCALALKERLKPPQASAQTSRLIRGSCLDLWWLHKFPHGNTFAMHKGFLETPYTWDTPCSFAGYENRHVVLISLSVFSQEKNKQLTPLERFWSISGWTNTAARLPPAFPVRSGISRVLVRAVIHYF